MEILINKDTGCCGSDFITFDIHRNGFNDVRIENIFESEFETTIQREGYVRKISSLHCYIHGQSEHKFLQDFKTTKEQLYEMFDINSDEVKKGNYLIKDIDPWICFSEAFDIILYFGKDKPIRKEKTVKSNTKHRLTWTHNSKHKFDGAPATYKYWDVKDKSKMIICSIKLDMLNCIFPELEYKFDCHWAFREEKKFPELIMNEPFKASREYEYPDDEKAEVLEKERKEREAKEKAERELEERKHTPGYCRYCGSEHAEYIPFEGEWMCRDCYYDMHY